MELLFPVISFFWGFFTLLLLTNGGKEKRFKKGLLYNCISFIGMSIISIVIWGSAAIFLLIVILLPALLISFIGTMIGFLFLK